MYPINGSVFDINNGTRTFSACIAAECMQMRYLIINDPIKKNVWSALNESGYPYRIIGSEGTGMFTYSIHRITNNKLMECMKEFFAEHSEITDIAIARTMSAVLTDGRVITVITRDNEIHQLIHASITEYTVKVKDKEGHEKDMYFVDYYLSKLDPNGYMGDEDNELSISISRHASLVNKDELVLGENTDYLLDFDPQPVEYDMSLIERVHVPSDYATDYMQDESVAQEMGIPSDRVDIAFSAPDACLLFLSNSDFLMPAKFVTH